MFICFIQAIHSIQPVDPSPALVVPPQCLINCTTAYGSILGSSFGVKAYSNCNSDSCFNFQDEGVVFPANITGFKSDVYTGMRWQCVQYARRWMVINLNITFASVDSAYQIFGLDEVRHLPTGRTLKFFTFKNDNERAPSKGDLIIYNLREDSPDGHVAVVVDINQQLGYVELAQQNYENQKWQSSFARRVRLQIQKNGQKSLYKVTDREWPDGRQNGLTVLGWKSISLKLNQ